MSDYDRIRKFVMDHMAYSGSRRHMLTDREWGFVYLCGDGFGTINERWARQQCWDWSHVRDSSDAGIDRMARAIAKILARKSRSDATVTTPDFLLISQVR